VIINLQETLFKEPYTFMHEKCPSCLMRKLCVTATGFTKGDRNYLFSLHHRKRFITGEMLAGKKMHAEQEVGIPTPEEAFDKLRQVLHSGGEVTLSEVPIHSVSAGGRGVIDTLRIRRDGDEYDIEVIEYKSQYWRPYFLQLGFYCYLLFSHDAEILLRLPIETKLKRLTDSGVLVERGVLSLLKKLKSRIDVEKLADQIVLEEGMLTTAAIRRRYQEGFSERPKRVPSCVRVYPDVEKRPTSISISGRLVIVNNGDKSEFPLTYCTNNVLNVGFGQAITRAIERRLKSLRQYHKAVSLYELEDLPYCRECGPNGQRCHYPEYCLMHPPTVKIRQMHFSKRTGAVVKTPPPRVL
jgi:hypothetical protein